MQGWPKAVGGQVIGLLGGSFDPAHSGHVDLTLTALQRFRLSQVWWLVSPGNPLKLQQPAPLAERMKASAAVMQHPRVTITDIEARMGTRYTAQTLRQLQNRYRGVKFVWLMGADNLIQFNLWQDWRWIMDNVPVGVLARPGARLQARFSPAARIYRSSRLPDRVAGQLGRVDTPAWCFVNMPLNAQSSTAMRQVAAWRKRDNTPIVMPDQSRIAYADD